MPSGKDEQDHHSTTLYGQAPTILPIFCVHFVLETYRQRFRGLRLTEQASRRGCLPQIACLVSGSSLERFVFACSLQFGAANSSISPVQCRLCECVDSAMMRWPLWMILNTFSWRAFVVLRFKTRLLTEIRLTLDDTPTVVHY